MRSFSLSDRGFTTPGLSGLRERNRALVHRWPAVDPARSLPNGVPVTGNAIDTGLWFTVPTVLLEALPIMTGAGASYLGARRAKVWTSPDTSTLRRAGLSAKTSPLTVKRAAALYRIVAAIDGVALELDPETHLLLPQAAPETFGTDTCWLSSASSGGGHTSPVTRLDGQMMTVANALLNLAYPCQIPLMWSLRRHCGSRRCVNPWHYVGEGQAPPVLRALEAAIAVPAGTMQAKLPLPRLSPMDGLVDFTATWTDWLDDCKRVLEAADAGPGPAARIEPEKMEPEDVLALFGD